MEGVIFGILRYIVNLKYLENVDVPAGIRPPKNIVYSPIAPPPNLRSELLQTIPHPRARRAGLVLGAASGDANRSN